MRNPAAVDRILPITRAVAVVVIPFLVAAFVILYGYPTETDRLFAWPLRPTMSAMMLAAAYAGGIYFFTAVVVGKRWHRIKVGLLPVTAFASSLGLATAIHWDRFNHDHPAFYAWAGLYFSTPVIVLVLWFVNRKQDPRAEPGDPVIPVAARVAFGAVGATALLIAAVLMVQPGILIDVWPWKLTPLTARVMAALFCLPGVVGIGISMDRRWSAARTILQSQFFSTALILIAIYRARNEFDWAGPAAWLFLAGMAGVMLVILLVYGAMEQSVSRRSPLPSE